MITLSPPTYTQPARQGVRFAHMNQPKQISNEDFPAFQSRLFEECSNLRRRLSRELPNVWVETQNGGMGEKGYYTIKTSPQAPTALFSIQCTPKGVFTTTGYEVTLQSSLKHEDYSAISQYLQS